MLSREWKKVEGFSNMGEDYESLVARKADGVIEVAYAAFGGLKVIELKGVTDVVESTELTVEDIMNAVGDDWEIAIPMFEGDVANLYVVDSCSNVYTVEEYSQNKETNVECVSSEEYDVDSLSELEYELLKEFDLA